MRKSPVNQTIADKPISILDSNKRLYQNVIMCAIFDLKSRSKIYGTFNRSRANHWFFSREESVDFETVCDFAELDPEYIRDVARIVKKGNKKILTKLRKVLTYD